MMTEWRRGSPECEKESSGGDSETDVMLEVHPPKLVKPI